MKVEYHRNFVKNFKTRFKGNAKLLTHYEKRLKLFIEDPAHPILRDHKLSGEKVSLRAFSITGDVRVVYKRSGERIIFLDIGTHNQVY